MKCIECVEKAFLGLLLAADELNVINQEDVHRPVLRMEVSSLTLADCSNELIGELLSSDTEEPQTHGLKAMAYSLKEMGLPKANTPIDE
jgi:hypothetical protein